MLLDIVERAFRRKRRWCPKGLHRDMRQEGYVSVLEAERSGVIDPDELQRIAELRMKRFIEREMSAQIPVPIASFEDDEE